jgi:hypothetical protein
MTRSLFACGLAGLLLVFVAVKGAAQIKQGKTRPLETKVWMRNVNGPQCSALGKLLKAGPADDKAWEEVAQHAEMLNEASYVLMADGRCPDAAWANGSKELKEATDAMLKSIAAKDTAAAQADFQKVLGACKTCHTAHKK